MLELVKVKNSDKKLREFMSIHYFQPKGFVGRNICYNIYYNKFYYGSIVGGSATLHLVGRDDFFNLTKDNKKEKLKNIVNNIFYHIEKVENKYPKRNFTTLCLIKFMEQIKTDWEYKYKDKVIGFESLVELPRTGDLYKKAGWKEVGITKGQTCKRIAGSGTDSWTGKRIWDTVNLPPKRVFVYKYEE